MLDERWRSTARTLQEDGVCIIRQGLDKAQLETLANCFDWSVSHPSDNANQFTATSDKPGRFYADINNPALVHGETPYRRFLFEQGLPELLSQLWEGSPVWFLYEQVLLKENGEARRTPWHQDSSYLPIGGNQLVIAWMTLDPTPREYTLEFVKGSHRGPLYDGSKFTPGDDTDPIYGNGVMPRLPDIEQERDQWPIVGWDVEPGDILLFHPATLHGGAATHAAMRRRTVSLRFFGEDAIYAPLPADGVENIGIEGETLWKKLAHSLKAGDPLRDPDMPLLWSGAP